MMRRKPKRNSCKGKPEELESELRKTERAAEKARDKEEREKATQFSKRITEWSVLETAKSRILGSDEEEKEIAKNRMNPECG